MIRVLFILKQRGNSYDPVQSDTGAWGNRSFTGLHNSVKYIIEMLHKLGIEAHSSTVADNNDIDREVHKYKPTHVIIEALWVVPSKFEILTKLHPTVKWYIRLHSEIPFIAQEGIAFKWMFEYIKYPNVNITSNSKRLIESIRPLLKHDVIYSPNYYPVNDNYPYYQSTAKVMATSTFNIISIGCFGAIRPLKNQLMQAVAAIRFADMKNCQLYYHINADRIEGGGLPILHNIKALFENSNHKLIEHGWLNADEFKNLLIDQIQLGLQVSFSETFNIISADMTAVDIPIVVSPEVSWADPEFQADPTYESDILQKMHIAWNGRLFDRQHANFKGLVKFNKHSEKEWEHLL